MTEKSLYQGRHLQFVKRGNWEYVKRHNCTGIVIIVAMTVDRRVIFVEQYRPPVRKSVIEFPAGLVNHNRNTKLKKVRPLKKETLVNAAKRELLEETGYKAKKIKILMEGPVSGGFTSDIVTMVQALDITKVGEGGGMPEEDESIVVHHVPLRLTHSWLGKMERKGHLIEPKIYAGLYFLREYNRGSRKR